MLLQSKNTLTIKKEHQLTYKNKVFIKQLIPSSPNWNPIEKKEINKNASENRKKLLTIICQKIKIVLKVENILVISIYKCKILSQTKAIP
ncbi:hypothetical protein [Spiroplasma endosymbiont of Villa modesta]|uniref:hypothetical protein n=1 Tax=Spiroplasma endosymbiont of Villa modesta TaxID=3066293 RepID=UPI00313ADE5C